MPSPVTPQDFKALISDPSATLCGNFINTLLKLPITLYKFINWFLDSNGNVSKSGLNGIRAPSELIFSAGTLAEDGTRLLCDGREVSNTDPLYVDLFNAIGNTYGTPSGSNVFKIPDYRARFPVGIGNFAASGAAALGVAGGEDKHQLVTAELPMHRHFVASTDQGDFGFPLVTPSTFVPRDGYKFGGSTFQSYQLWGTATEATTGLTSQTGSDTGHNNLPPFLPAYIYIQL